jgi:putative hydrolase of the HAD superfamily
VNCRAVLFDLFDTLLYAEPKTDADAQLADLLAGAGISREVWERCLKATIRPTLRGEITLLQRVRTMLHEAGADGADPFVADQLAGLLCARWVPRLYADVRPALAQLRERGYRLALVSNIASYSLHWMPEFELDRCFEALVFSCQEKSLKPEPEMYLHAAARLDMSPRECVFVGDGMDGELSGARAVGMNAVRIDREVRESDAPRDDCFDHCVSDLKGLLDWLPRCASASD